jgi:hypothetical protein
MLNSDDDNDSSSSNSSNNNNINNSDDDAQFTDIYLCVSSLSFAVSFHTRQSLFYTSFSPFPIPSC